MQRMLRRVRLPPNMLSSDTCPHAWIIKYKPAACVAACAACRICCSAHGHAHRACVLRLLGLLICLFQGNVVDVQVCAVTLALKAAA